MEFCEKKTLRNYIDADLYKDTKKVWQMFREIVDGLVHIHTQGMIHRDLKPVNIFIDSHGHIKIGDFGLATTELLATKTGSVVHSAVGEEVKKQEISESIEVKEDITGLVGTALYTAPEVNIRTTVYNQKVDLYSLGVIFFEMSYPPLQTGMERIKVLTGLRESSIRLPKDWDCQLLRQQTYIVNWLLDHDAMKRPTSHELLMSDYLPPPHVEQSRIEETVRNAMKNKKSNAYRQLISSCMTQMMSEAKDIYFDTDMVKPAVIKRLGAAHSHFYAAARKVFELHGAIPLDCHLLLPVNTRNTWILTDTDTCVQLMTRNGDVVSLPHDLRLPFARYLPRLKLNNFKRFSFGKVVKEKKVFGLHPKQFTECAFDIVTSPAGQIEADAEVLIVCQHLINELGEWDDTKFVFRLSHGALIKGLFFHVGIEEKFHSKVVDYIKTYSNHHKAQFIGRLQNIGVSDTNISSLITFMECDTGLSNLSSLLRPVTKRRTEYAELVKFGLNQLKQVETVAKRLGLKIELQFSVKSLYPPSVYSGITFQIMRVLTKKSSRNMDIVGAGGRYNELVRNYQQFFDVRDVTSSKQTSGTDGSNEESGQSEDEICATGFSLSVDRLAAALAKQQNFNFTIAQVLVAGEGSSDMYHVITELWNAGIKTFSSHTSRMDELREQAIELGAEIVILVTQDHVRVSFGDKEGRFMGGEKKMSVSEVVNLVTRELKLQLSGGLYAGGGVEGDHKVTVPTIQPKEEKLNMGPSVFYNFDYLDRERYSISKKKLEIRKSEKLAAAISRFDCSCSVLVLALSLPGQVVKAVASTLECEDEDKFQSSLTELNKMFPRYRKYLDEVCSEIEEARFKQKTVSSIVLVSLDDNSFKIIH